jgi:uncharacterized protein YdhG (YjbR/CyaY superfamily)
LGGAYLTEGHAGEFMATGRSAPKSIDEYIAAFPPEVRAILERVRLTISNAAPGAQEGISYQIPTFTLHGALVYFAAFKNHIGFYPPVKAMSDWRRRFRAMRERRVICAFRSINRSHTP